MNNPFMLVIVAVTLGACAQYQAQQQQEQAAQAQAVAANDDAKCKSYGATPGSSAYVQCRMNLDNQRANMRAAFASQLAGRIVNPPQQPQPMNVNVCNVPGQVNTCMYR